VGLPFRAFVDAKRQAGRSDPAEYDGHIGLRAEWRPECLSTSLTVAQRFVMLEMRVIDPIPPSR